jgi:hypothetical protein
MIFLGCCIFGSSLFAVPDSEQTIVLPSSLSDLDLVDY